jgi:hypothetical protein
MEINTNFRRKFPKLETKKSFFEPATEKKKKLFPSWKTPIKDISFGFV